MPPKSSKKPQPSSAPPPRDDHHQCFTSSSSSSPRTKLQQHRTGQASWFCSSGLPSDLTVEVDDMIFHLHQYPLVARSGKFAMLVAEATHSNDSDDEGAAHLPPLCHIQLKGLPGGPDIFELVAEFCYGVKVDITPTNVAALRCAADYLDMSEEYGEYNLIRSTEKFLNRVVVQRWEDCVKTLKSCETLLPQAEDLAIVDRCVESMALHASTGDGSSRSSINGSRRGLTLSSRNSDGDGGRRSTDWWYEDVSILSLPLFKCVLKSMEEKGMGPENIAGAVMHYAKKLIPGLHRRKDGGSSNNNNINSTANRYSRKLLNSSQNGGGGATDSQQLYFLETIERLLPWQEKVVSTSFLCGLLKVALMLQSSHLCRSNLEKRVAAQLQHATLEDLLIPNYSQSVDTLYDVDCVLRIVNRFLVGSKKLARLMEDVSTSSRSTPESGSYKRPPPLPRQQQQGELQMIASASGASAVSRSSLRKVGRLMDAYLAEVASDSNLSTDRFQSLVEALPQEARPSNDGLYRAIDIFLKTQQPWMKEADKERVCEAINCERLSLDACAHVAQNQRLPLRLVLQVLYMEQIQLRGAIMGEASVSSRQQLNNIIDGDDELRRDVHSLRLRISELELQSTRLRSRIKTTTTSSKSPSSWSSISSKLTCKSHLASDISPSPSSSAHIAHAPHHFHSFSAPSLTAAHALVRNTTTATNSPLAAAASESPNHIQKARRSVTYLDTTVASRGPADDAAGALHRSRRHRRSTTVRQPFLSISPL